MLEIDGALMTRKKAETLTLDELLASIPADFSYPEDVNDFVESRANGQELL